jgi:hypothetical protein
VTEPIQYEILAVRWGGALHEAALYHRFDEYHEPA